jgi:hypothetical protein
MDVEWGPEAEWGSGPRLDEFLLARIAEDKRLATDVDHPEGSVGGFDATRIAAECSAKRRIVLACRESRPDLSILSSRPTGMRDLPLSPHDQHQLAALTLALLALPYAGHRDYQEAWRP